MEKLISGKVRDVYKISDSKLVIVTTDRISAYDVVMAKPVKNKGKILNLISLFWFDYTKALVPNHIISYNPSDMPEYFRKEEYRDRMVLVKKLKMIPYEFIVRGYIFGNMWNAYCENKKFCGEKIKGDYKLAEKLDTPILTPSTKATAGHDEYVSFEHFADDLGIETAEKIKDACLKLYVTCYKYAYEKGIIIADTKFEFGFDENNDLVLADEIFTPDSSRFWSLDEYQTGVSPKSYDKQFIRDWLTNNMTDGKMQFDSVPDDIIKKTENIYAECLKKIIGREVSL